MRFVKALIKYIIFGKRVSLNEYLYRLNICNKCEHLDDWKCTNCGCYLNKKAIMSTEKCPVEKW